MPRRSFDQWQKDRTGASTTTPAGADDAALAADTPVIVGGGLTDPRGDAGATSSPASTNRAIGRGWRPGPKPGALDSWQLPSKFQGYVRWLYEHEAIEVVVFVGGAELVVGETRIELNPGRWIVVQVDDKIEGLPPNVAFAVQRELLEGGEP